MIRIVKTDLLLIGDLLKKKSSPFFRDLKLEFIVYHPQSPPKINIDKLFGYKVNINALRNYLALTN